MKTTQGYEKETLQKYVQTETIRLEYLGHFLYPVYFGISKWRLREREYKQTQAVHWDSRNRLGPDQNTDKWTETGILL